MAVKTNTAKPASDSRISFRPDAFVAGGILPEGDYKVNEARAVNWDYDGKSQKMGVFLRLMLEPVEGGDVVNQHYSAGDAEKWTPSEDGTGLVATGTATGLSKSSNLFLFIENLVNAGWPVDKLGNDFTVLEGAIIHFIHIPMPKRANMPKSNLLEGEQTQERERTIPVPGTIVKLPWDKAPAAKSAAKPNGAAKPAPAAQAATNGDGDASEKLAELLADVVAENADGIDRTKARLALFRACTKAKMAPADRDGIMNAFGDDATLGAALEGLGFKLNGSSIEAA